MIEIDRSFVGELATSAGSAAIVRAVAALGASLGVATTAEGAETAEQPRPVRAAGCAQAQGYLVGRPAPAAEVRQLLASSRRNNPRDGVTGASMFSRGCLGRVLEGPRARVERTFERIRRDPRHAGVTPLGFGPAERRGFPSWPIAFAGESGFEPAPLDGDRLYGLPRGLVLEEEDGAAAVA